MFLSPHSPKNKNKNGAGPRTSTATPHPSILVSANAKRSKYQTRVPRRSLVATASWCLAAVSPSCSPKSVAASRAESFRLSVSSVRRAISALASSSSVFSFPISVGVSRRVLEACWARSNADLLTRAEPEGAGGEACAAWAGSRMDAGARSTRAPSQCLYTTRRKAHTAAWCREHGRDVCTNRWQDLYARRTTRFSRWLSSRSSGFLTRPLSSWPTRPLSSYERWMGSLSWIQQFCAHLLTVMGHQHSFCSWS